MKNVYIYNENNCIEIYNEKNYIANILVIDYHNNNRV